MQLGESSDGAESEFSSGSESESGSESASESDFEPSPVKAKKKQPAKKPAAPVSKPAKRAAPVKRAAVVVKKPAGKRAPTAAAPIEGLPAPRAGGLKNGGAGLASPIVIPGGAPPRRVVGLSRRGVVHSLHGKNGK